MADYSEGFLKRTIEVWQPHSPVALSLEDAREIAENMRSLISLLSDLDRKYGQEKKKVQP